MIDSKHKVGCDCRIHVFNAVHCLFVCFFQPAPHKGDDLPSEDDAAAGMVCVSTVCVVFSPLRCSTFSPDLSGSLRSLCRLCGDIDQCAGVHLNLGC